MLPRNSATAGFRCWRGNTALLFLLAAASTQAKTGPGPGTALSFDGVNGVMGIGAAPLPVPWTAEFWVNPKTAVGQPQRAQRTQGRELAKGTVFTRQVIAPVCPTAHFSLGSLGSLRLNCS